MISNKAKDKREGYRMKAAIFIAGMVLAGSALGFSTPQPQYECKLDPRGVLVCYPKPRGF